MPAHDRERITRILDGVLETGVAASYETRAITPSGPVLYVVRVSPLRVAGEIRYAILVSLDITNEYQRRLITERDNALLAALERVNRIMLAGATSQPVFDRVLGEMLEIFQCDRALLAYPCDPNAGQIEIVFEQTAPGFSRRKGRAADRRRDRPEIGAGPAPSRGSRSQRPRTQSDSSRRSRR